MYNGYLLSRFLYDIEWNRLPRINKIIFKKIHLGQWDCHDFILILKLNYAMVVINQIFYYMYSGFVRK
jgi:hypothetical protein